MSELNADLEFSKYFKKLLPTEIHINKEDIYYRDKYNEIINYIKAILTDSEDLEYNKYIKLKGTLLVNVQPGSDVIDFLKLISSNYYLELYELINFERILTQVDYFKNFIKVLENLEKYDRVDNNDKELTKEEVRKKLILIKQPYNYNANETLKTKNLLWNFINYVKNNKDSINFIEKNLIIIWLHYDYNEISKFSVDLFELFDLFIRIPVLNKFERETILRNFSEKNPKLVFDINAIINSTENWEVKDIKQLLKIAIFKHYLNSDLNTVSNEITDIIIDLIETGEFIPSRIVNDIDQKRMYSTENMNQNSVVRSTDDKEIHDQKFKDRNSIFEKIRNESISEFMVNQLYENAASKNYNELLIIIDKLNKKEPTEDNERKILARYPFILNDSPNMAQLNLEKAKKRVDLLKKAFGK